MSTVPVNDKKPIVQYNAYAGQTTADWTFWVENASDLDVYIDGVLKTLNTHYTMDLTKLENDNGGPVTFLSALVGTEKITFARTTKVDRVTGFSESGGGSYRGEAINLELSRIIAMIQDKARDIDRCVALEPFSTYAGSLTLPDASAGKTLKWAADGLSLINSTYDPDEQEALAAAQVTLAIAQATAAASSASAASTSASNAAASETLASEWASQTSGIVASTDYSAKEFAQGSLAGTGGSAKNWAQQTGADVTGASSNSRSAKSWAQDDLHGATLGGSAKDWAQSASLPDGVNKSAKSYASDAQTSADDAATSAANAAASEAALNLRTIVNSSANYTVVAADRNKLIEYTGTGGHSIFLTAAATLGSGFEFHVKNAGSGNVVIDPNGAETIDGSATVTITPNQAVVVVCDGSNFQITQSRGYGSGSGTVTSVDASNGVKVSGGGPIASTGTILATRPITTKSTTYTVVSSDRGNVISCTGTWTMSLTAAATLASDFFFHIRNDGTGIITIDPNGSETINGATTITVYPGEAFSVVCDGTKFLTIGRQTGWIPLATLTASGSTSLDFTSYINSDFQVYKFDVEQLIPASNASALYVRVSQNAGSTWDAGSDYSQTVSATYGTGTAATGGSNADTQFPITYTGNSNTNLSNAKPVSGTVQLFTPSATGNQQLTSHLCFYSSASQNVIAVCSGTYIAAAAITGVRFMANTGNLTSGKVAMSGWRQS